MIYIIQGDPFKRLHYRWAIVITKSFKLFENFIFTRVIERYYKIRYSHRYPLFLSLVFLTIIHI